MTDGGIKMSIAGRDRSADLAEELVAQAELRSNPDLAEKIEKEKDILCLKDSDGIEDYLNRHLLLMCSRNCVDPASFDLPSGRGVIGVLLRFIRRLFWKISRWQCDQMAFRQNAVNVQTTYLIEFERDARRKQIADLSERVEKLESILDERNRV